MYLMAFFLPLLYPLGPAQYVSCSLRISNDGYSVSGSEIWLGAVLIYLPCWPLPLLSFLLFFTQNRGDRTPRAPSLDLSLQISKHGMQLIEMFQKV